MPDGPEALPSESLLAAFVRSSLVNRGMVLGVTRGVERLKHIVDCHGGGLVPVRYGSRGEQGVGNLGLSAPGVRSRISGAEFSHYNLVRPAPWIGVDLPAQVRPALPFRLSNLAPQVSPGGGVVHSGCLDSGLSGALQGALIYPSESQAAPAEIPNLGGPPVNGLFPRGARSPSRHRRLTGSDEIFVHGSRRGQGRAGSHWAGDWIQVGGAEVLTQRFGIPLPDGPASVRFVRRWLSYRCGLLLGRAEADVSVVAEGVSLQDLPPSDVQAAVEGDVDHGRGRAPHERRSRARVRLDQPEAADEI
ncbi:Uncharacterized protein FWK35_00015802 [Aphis craccivora]|uniref:Uncharacterized protein n=1 Tax=Aphis craccivora TaxID=307492 RepID=A0A6G0ZGE0_APHCR|nr:Uncharacterized protein FWK35_00015802 [Aphis craccivora]